VKYIQRVISLFALVFQTSISNHLAIFIFLYHLADKICSVCWD